MQSSLRKISRFSAIFCFVVFCAEALHCEPAKSDASATLRGLMEYAADTLRERAFVPATAEELKHAFVARLLSSLDTQARVFTESDVEEFEKIDLLARAAEGNFKALEPVWERHLKRLREQKAWIADFLSLPLPASIPRIYPQGGWTKPVHDESELHLRWEAYVAFQIYAAAGRISSEPTPAIWEKIQEQVAGGETRVLERQIAAAEHFSDESRTVLLVNSRLTCVDKYGLYISPKDIGEGRNLLGKAFPVNLGLTVAYRAGKLPLVEGIFPGSPAAESKLISVGDQISGATSNGKEITLENQREFYDLFARNNIGRNKEVISLSVRKANSKTVKVDLAFDWNLPPESVVTHYDAVGPSGKMIRIISVPSFIENDPSLTKETISTVHQVDQALRSPGKFDAVLLDLRGNPGGILNQAVDLAGLFVRDAGIWAGDRKHGATVVRRYEVSETKTRFYPTVPLAVWVNSKSASATEIVTSILKDSRRAVVLGEPTFGKGLFQSFSSPADGGKFKTTAGAYYDAGGNPLHLHGVTPDFLLPTAYPARERENQIRNPRPLEPIVAPRRSAVVEGDALAVRSTVERFDRVKHTDPDLTAYYTLLEDGKKNDAVLEVALDAVKIRALFQQVGKLHRLAAEMGLMDAIGGTTNLAAKYASAYPQIVLRVFDAYLQTATVRGYPR